LFVVCVWLPLNALASAGTGLFGAGSEKFILHDASGTEPHFHLLSSSPARKALAALLITALNADPDTAPKLAVSSDGINVAVQSITLTPHPKNAQYLMVSLQASGQNLLLEKLLKKDDFISGKTINYEIPLNTRSLALNSVSLSGKMVFHLDTKKNQLQINTADAKVEFSSSLLDSDAKDAPEAIQETMHFSGTGIRQLAK